MGNRSYPIWNQVQACIYKSSKSWGAKDTCAVTVNVGSSSRRSDVLVQHVTTRQVFDDYTDFQFAVRVPPLNERVPIAHKRFIHKTGEFIDIPI